MHHRHTMPYPLPYPRLLPAAFALAACLASALLAAQDTLPPTMVLVQGGTFTMGCTAEQQPDCRPAESPAHEVTLTDFYIGKYEVTQGQWEILMGYTQAQMRDLAGSSSLYGVGSSYPIYYVSWYDAAVFCNRLSEQAGYAPCYYSDAAYTQVYGKSGTTWSLPNTGTVYWKPDAKGYRLPTEAEWEYTARGGSLNKGHKYSGSNTIGDVAWYTANSGNETRAIGAKTANELGFFDMSGNVWEWCFDWYGSSYYGSSTVCTPVGPGSGSYRMLRGGSWGADAIDARVANRYIYGAPSDRIGGSGFRLCRTP